MSEWKEFQMLWDFDEDDNNVPHPIATLLKSDPTLSITSLYVGENWEDDHLPCYNITCVVNGEEFTYSDWWLSMEGVKMYCQAEVSQEQRDEVRTHIIESME